MAGYRRFNRIMTNICHVMEYRFIEILKCSEIDRYDASGASHNSSGLSEPFPQDGRHNGAEPLGDN